MRDQRAVGVRLGDGLVDRLLVPGLDFQELVQGLPGEDRRAAIGRSGKRVKLLGGRRRDLDADGRRLAHARSSQVVGGSAAGRIMDRLPGPHNAMVTGQKKAPVLLHLADARQTNYDQL